MSAPEPEIDWPSEEALRAYAWWDFQRSLAELKRETALLYAAEIRKLLNERPEWVLSRQNDFHLFHEDFSGVLYLQGDDDKNTGVLE